MSLPGPRSSQFGEDCGGLHYLPLFWKTSKKKNYETSPFSLLVLFSAPGVFC